MRIEAQLPDGTILEFPDGTPDSVVDAAVQAEMRRRAGDPETRRQADIMRRAGGGAGIAHDPGVSTLGGNEAPERSGREWTPPNPAERHEMFRRQAESNRAYRERPQDVGESDLQYRARLEEPRRDAARLDNQEQGPDIVRETTAYIGTRLHNMNPQEYPWLFRRGQRITQGEIAELVQHSSARIEGMTPEEATRELFGRREDRPARTAFPGSPEPAAPEFQRDLAQTGEAGRARERAGWDDSVRLPDDTDQRAEAEFEREVRQQRLSRFGREGPGFFGGVGQNLLGVIQRVGGGLIGATGTVLEDLAAGGDGDSNYLQRLGRYVGERGRQRQAAANPGYAEWSPQWVAFQMVETTAEMGGAIAVSLGTRNPEMGAALLMGTRVGAEQYDESIRIGRTPNQALQDGLFYGIAEMIPERMALGRIMQPGTGRLLVRVGRGAGTGVLTEGAQEMFTEALQISYDAGIIRDDMTWGEARNRMLQAGVIGGLTGGVIGGGVQGIQKGAGVEGEAPPVVQPETPAEAFEGESELTEADRASPLPDDLIARGRAEISRGQGRRRPRAPRQAEPETRNTFERMVQITLGAEGGGTLERPNVSPRGARGPMQVMPGTDSDPGYGVRPMQNNSEAERARVGRDYLAAMLRHYGGDPAKMWAAYNWGPGNLDNAIQQHGANWLDHAPPETRAYVMRNLSRLGGAGFNSESGDVRTFSPQEIDSSIDTTESAEAFVQRVLGPNFGMTQPESTTADVRAAEIDQHRMEPPQPSTEAGLPEAPPPLEGAPQSAAAPPLTPAGTTIASEVEAARQRPGSAGDVTEAANVVPNLDPEVARAIGTRLRTDFEGTRLTPVEIEALKRAGAITDLSSGEMPHAFRTALLSAANATPETEQAQEAPPAARVRFNPEVVMPQLQQYVAGRGALDPKSVASKLGIQPAQAGRALAALASRPNSGIRVSRSGKVRRIPQTRTPVDAIRFLRNRGGIRDDGGHDLVKGRNWHLAAPGLINRNGVSIDYAGEALHEAGFFPNRPRDDRPTEAEVLEFIENAMKTRAYSEADIPEVQQREAQADSKKALENARYAVRDLAENLDLDLLPSEIDDAADYIAAGETVEIAVQRALDEASARALYDLADETGRDFYETIAETIYEGATAEQRGGGSEEGSLGTERVAGDAGQRPPPGDQPRAADQPEVGAEQDVETRAGVGAPAEEALPPAEPQPAPTVEATRPPPPDESAARRAANEGHPAHGLIGDKIERFELPGRKPEGVPLADIGVGQGTDGKWYSRYGYMPPDLSEGSGVASPVTHSPAFETRQQAIDRAAIEVRIRALRNMRQFDDSNRANDAAARKADEWAQEQMSFEASAYDLSTAIDSALTDEFRDARQAGFGPKPESRAGASPKEEAQRIARALIEAGYTTGGMGKDYHYSVGQDFASKRTPDRIHVQIEGQEVFSFNYANWPQHQGIAWGDFKLKTGTESKERAIRALIASGEERAAERAEAPADDLFGEQDGDRRRALERQAEGRKRSDKAQRAPGEGGGLFDTRDTTGDLVAKTEPQEGYGAKNRLVTANRASEIRDRLKAKLSGAQLNTGLDPELIALGTELAVFHIEAGARSFSDFAAKVADDLGVKLADLKRYLRGWYNGARDMLEDAGESVDGMDDPDAVRAALAGIEDSQSSDIRNKGEGDAPATRNSLEPDRSGATAEDGVRQEDVPAVAGEPGRSAGSGDLTAEEGGGERPAGESGAAERGAVPVGERGDSGVRGGPSRAPGSAAESGGVERGRDDGERGLPAGHVPAEAVERTAANSPGLEAKRAAQRAANTIAIKPGDLDNIRETLPYLKPTQQDDVLAAEARFARPDAYGMLFTNGTGTGKTFVGGGVHARLYRQGKTEQLIITPSQDIAESWKAALGELGVPAAILESTEDGGKGVSITTFANFYQNMALLDRDFDIVTPDEAQKLSANKEGETTSALTMMRALTYHPRGLYDRAKMVLRDEWAEFDDLRRRGALTTPQKQRYDALLDKTRALEESFATKPRVPALFLSATPWSYVESVDWAEGYLFDYGKDDPRTVGRYNAPNARESFFIQHFGYRMRTGKLTKPEAQVDSGVMEREFHEWLKREGALSGRVLDVDADYDRKFVLVDDAVGNQIDSALDFLANADGGKFRPIHDLVSKKFDYLSRMRLLEAIKAQHAIPMIQRYHELGRKVVVFHDYNEGGGFSPFILHLDPQQKITTYKDNRPVTVRPYELYQEFLDRNPQVKKLDFSKFPAPLVTLTKAFPDAVIYNGTVPSKKRRAGKDSFNTDGPGTPNVIIIQSAAGEYGIGVHDTSGAHMRMTVNLGMPVRPTTAIQEEGRTRREGSVTDAGYRYMNTGTAWERWTFAGKIAERASTAENLALGNQARHLRQSFIDAFNDSALFEASDQDGKGGKEADRANNSLTPFQKAKTFYFAQQKKTGRRDQREGLDYFATPEPLGYKMVEWAGIRANDRALEPEAGHGAIARFLPEYADRTLIEPSTELLSRAALASPGSRTLAERFEDLHVTNKFDAIVMNPPFGLGGKTAIEHLAKAATHLRNGGRIVALIPEGPAADKRFEAWYDGKSAEGLLLVSSISLPPVTFERAGTKVRTRVVILDRQTDRDIAARIEQSNRDVSAETIAELFDGIENMTVPARIEPQTPDQAGALTLGGLTYGAPAGQVSVSEKPTFETGETKHGKTGEDLFVATITERVERPAFDRILATAKQHGGYYSSYQANGAIPGFQFKSAADRDAFIGEAGVARSAVQEGKVGYEQGRFVFPRNFQRQQERERQADTSERYSDGTTAAQRAAWFAMDDAAQARWEAEDAREIEAMKARGGRFMTRDEVLTARIAEGPPVTVGMVLDIQQIVEPDTSGLNRPKRAMRRWIVRETDNYVTVLDPAEGNPEYPQGVGTVSLMEVMRGGNAREVRQGAPRPTLFSKTEGGFDFDAAQPSRSMTQRQRAELEARQQQSMSRRGGQVGAGDQEGGLFANERDQGSLFALADGAPRPRLSDEVTAAVRAEVARMGIGDKVVLNVVDELFDNEKIAGLYQRGLIVLAINNPQKPTFTINHEAVHALKDLGLFKGDEWRALVRRAKAHGTLMNSVRTRYADEGLTEDQLLEEAIAEMYAGWRQGRLESGYVRSALQRVLDFFKALHGAITRAGQAEAIMRAIEGGEIGSRVAEEGHALDLTATRLSRTEDEEGSPETRWLLSDGALDAIRERADAWRVKLQDRMLPLLRTQQRIEAQTGERLPEGVNPYLAEELMSGRVGARLETMTDKMVLPLFEAMKKGGVSLDEIETYLYARHAPERNARIAEINPDFEEGTGSGMTDEEAAEIMEEVERQGKTEIMVKLAERVDDLLDFALETRVETGLLSREEADAWRERYEHYVPLRGIAEADPEAAVDRPSYGSGINVRGPESRRAFGRRSRARNILSYSLLQAEEAIVRGGMNEVGQTFYEFAAANPDSNFWRVDKISRKPAFNKETGQVEYRTTNRLTAEDAPYTVSLKIDGLEHRVTMNRNNAAAVRLAAAMRNLHGTQLGGIMRVMGGVNRFLSTVNTTLSPEFVITNAFRDLQTASINLQGVELDGITRGVLKDYKEALKASMKGSFGKESGEWGRWYREFIEAGGRVYFNRIDDLNEIQRTIEKQFKRHERRAAGGVGGTYETGRAGAVAVFKFIENVNLGVENAIRLSAYKNARERGLSSAQAASLAKNLTVNFNRRGEWGTATNALYLFYNASVQGVARMLQAVRSKRVRRFLYAAVVAGFMLDLLNSLVSDDDDDGESFYDKIPAFDKSRNLIIMIPGARGKHIRIPLPYGYNIFYGMGRALSETARNPSVGQALDSGAALSSTIVDSFNPIGGTNSLLNFIAPTVADPIVDLSLNRDFAGRPIMPEQNAHGPQVPDNQRYWGSVSPHWRIITDTLNQASGGDEVVPGWVDVSPETLEYLGVVATGSAGNFFQRTTGLVEKVVAGEQVEANDIPLVRRVIGSPPRWYNKAAFYARVGQIEQAVEYLDNYRDNGMDEAASAYEERNSALLDLRSEASSARRRMRGLRGERAGLDQLHDRGEIDRTVYREQHRALQAEEDEIIADFNRAYLAVINPPRRP